MASDVTAPEISYEDARALARDADPKVRNALAERTDIEPEILYFLAGDDSAEVRNSVARNLAAPRQTFHLLAQDDSEHVREGLADKIAHLAPDLDEGQRDQLWKSTHEALSILAQDQMVRVRQAMAEALKDVTGAPSDVIRKLANDVEVVVSSPVLEFSPVLSDADMLEIIQQGTASDNLVAISRRDGVSEPLSEAIVDADDTLAIAALLANDSAQIREETLDNLIDRAAGVKAWHEPLVHRPNLPASAPQRLAQFIADHLIEALENRADMDEATLAEVRELVKGRLEDEVVQDGTSDVGKRTTGGTFEFLEGPLPMVLVQRLAASNGLHDSVVRSALQAEDHRFVLAALVSLSGIDETVAKRIFAERNAKGIVALSWKAKMPANLIRGLQHRMARIAPGDMLAPAMENASGGGEYPIAQKEMEWTLQFYQGLVEREARA